MSSILLSAKCIRSYLNLTRSLIISSHKNAGINFVRSQFLPTSFSAHKNYSSLVDPELSTPVKVETLINKLDSSVRRTSRVTRSDLDSVINQIKFSRSVTSSQALLILRCCGSLLPEELPETRTRIVDQLWETLSRLGIKFDISHYNVLLKVYLENGYKFSPSEFLSEIEQRGIQPNRVTYQRLIAQYCQSGDLAGATQILEFMKEKEIPINELVFNSLIQGHSVANDMESAEGIIGMMKETGLKPSNDTYTTLISAYAKNGNIDKVMELIDFCGKSDIELLDKDLLEIVYVLAINGHEKPISEILSRARKVVDYNQDSINVILRLIVAGKEDAAFEVYKTMNKAVKPDDSEGFENSSNGNFFIRQLVKSNRPFEKIQQYAQIMAESNSNNFVYLVGLRAALKENNAELSKKLMTLAAEKGFPVRPHYFWPLIQAEANNKNAEGVIAVLSSMVNDFNIYQLRETLREFVIPNLLKIGLPWNSIQGQLTALGIPSGTGASSLVYNLVVKDRLKEAAEVVTQYRAYYQPYFIRQPLVKAYFNTNDLESFLTILRHMYLSVQRFEEVSASEEMEDQVVPDKSIMLVKTVYEIVSTLARDPKSTERIELFLQGLLKNGLGINNECAERLRNWLKPRMTPELSDTIEKLTSSDLQPVAPEVLRTVSSALDEKTLEQIAETLRKKNKPTDGVKQQLFQLYCRNKKLDKALQIKQELEDAGVNFSRGNMALLIDLFISMEDLDKALELYQNLENTDPEFALDFTKTLKLATLLIQKDKLDDAISLLSKRTPTDKKSEESLYLQNNMAWRLLNAVGEKRPVEDVEKFLDILTSKNYVEISNMLLGPVIKSILNKGDLKGALDKFESICQKYRFTPLKKELTKKFIEVEDAASLQRLTDLSTEIHGEVNSLYDLMFAFLELGRLRQARKILETPGLRVRQDRLIAVSQKFAEEGQVDSIRNLLEITKDINSIDRSRFYLHILQVYCKENNVEKAYGLWTQMQEEDETPSNEFLTTLANLLKKNNREIPFDVPQPTLIEKAPKQKTDKTSLQRFKNFVQLENIDKALLFKDDPTIPPVQKSSLIALLLKADRMTEASKLVLELLKEGHYPKPAIFRFFLQKLSFAGDIKTMNEIGKHLNFDLKKTVFFQSKLCKAYHKAGKIKEYLETLKSNLEKVQDEDDSSAVFPARSILRLVIQEPELLPNLENLAEILRKKNLKYGDIILWNAYFILNSNQEKCNSLFSSISKSGEMYHFPALNIAKEQEDLDLLNRLKDTVFNEPESSTTLRKKASIINTYLFVFNVQNRIEEALSFLESSIGDVDVSSLSRNTLLKLKEKAEAKNIQFKYTIPEEIVSNKEDEDSQKLSTH